MESSKSGAISHISGHVLVVDDDPTMQRTLRRLLMWHGHWVTVASDGERALEVLSRYEPDAVVTDLDMPVVGGLELLQYVRDLYPDVSVLLLTGNPRVETAARGMRHGAYRYLTKPIDARELAEDVHTGIQQTWAARTQRAVLSRNQEVDWTLIERSFEAALEGLWMAFQPIVHPDGQLYGYEALMRSREPSMGNPGLILDAAEQLSRVRQLGRVVRQMSAEVFERCAPEGVLLFVNLHPLELMDAELYAPDSALARIASRVVLEVTERVSLREVDALLGRVEELRRLGFRVAVDDLGEGYASLTSLTSLQPHVVKLDMSLVRGIDTNASKQKIVRSMVALAADMGVAVVAEGVETEQERAILVGLGCELLQGYLFGRPAPLEPRG